MNTLGKLAKLMVAIEGGDAEGIAKEGMSLLLSLVPVATLAPYLSDFDRMAGDIAADIAEDAKFGPKDG